MTTTIDGQIENALKAEKEKKNLEEIKSFIHWNLIEKDLIKN